MMITDEKIKQALDKAYKEAGHNAYFDNGFKAGVKFALRQIKNCSIPDVSHCGLTNEEVVLPLTKKAMRSCVNCKYFKLYKKVKNELDHYINMRGSSFGVGIGKDEYAVKWQGKQMRLEILEAFLEGRSPNWYFAYYLNNEERDRRNQSYCA